MFAGSPWKRLRRCRGGASAWLGLALPLPLELCCAFRPRCCCCRRVWGVRAACACAGPPPRFWRAPLLRSFLSPSAALLFTVATPGSPKHSGQSHDACLCVACAGSDLCAEDLCVPQSSYCTCAPPHCFIRVFVPYIVVAEHLCKLYESYDPALHAYWSGANWRLLNWRPSTRLERFSSRSWNWRTQSLFERAACASWFKQSRMLAFTRATIQSAGAHIECRSGLNLN